MKQVPAIAICWSVKFYSKNVSSQCNLTSKIEPMQDKIKYAIILP